MLSMSTLARRPLSASLRVALQLLLITWTLCLLGATSRAETLDPTSDEPAIPSLGFSTDSSEQNEPSAGSGSVPVLGRNQGATGKPVPVNSSRSSDESDGPRPFGAKLFMGNFLRTRKNGVNPNYVILPGDQVAVYAWGATDLHNVFVVDGQGNIFIPGVGPIRLAGVKNADLTKVVKSGLSRVFSRYLEVYTNLLTSNPVAVFVTGGVQHPGRYAGIPSDSVLFFLDQAGGIDPKLGSYRKISVLRHNQPIATVDLYDFLLRGVLPQIQFEDGDTILVHPRGPWVQLRGNVAVHCHLEFSTEPVSGSDALNVIPGSALATQVTLSGIRDGIPINHTLSLEAFRRFTLKDGDVITLRDDGRSDMIVVKLEGEFEGPSELAVKRGSRLVDVLNYVPVNTSLANVRAVHLRRSSVARAQKDSIDDALFRLERSSLLALSQSNGESSIRVKEAELALKFVERARLIQPLGRVVTMRDQQQVNLLLEDDDVIVVPARTNIVRIGGEVMMAQAVMFQPDRTAEEYITDAGGYTDRSDESRVIVIHPNAEVVIGDPGMDVLPGDEVLVPPRVDTKTLQNVADVTQIIYQVAVSAAVVLRLL